MDIRHAVGVKAGVSREKLADVLRYEGNPLFTPREQAALEFCERTTRDDLEMTDECLARVREHFAEPEIVELTFVAGYQIFASKFAKAFQLAPQGFSSQSPAR
jgi:alkylhydroperoxidase family enzyme